MSKFKIERSTTQQIMPPTVQLGGEKSSSYGLFPYFSLGVRKIHGGYESLAEWIIANKAVKIDGYVGVDWAGIRAQLASVFKARGLRVNWVFVHDYFIPEKQLNELIKPFLGEEGSVWGRNTSLELSQFYELESLSNLRSDSGYDLNIFYGTGSSLIKDDLGIIYIDLPKNELLFRMRADSAFNLGSSKLTDKINMYKRFYFVDWVVLNKHKEQLIDKISIYADSQWLDTINWIAAKDLLEGLGRMSKAVFRPRPWFDSGVWGGQWMKDKFAELSDEEENYAWSFEIIAPENGIVLESDGYLLEISFDMLMFAQAAQVLGSDHARFGNYFPIRFDFLDTFNGGNLSIQCHPSLPYIQENFGEKHTQDETYYILDCKDDAKVYLGFNEDINPQEFQKALKDSFDNETEIDVEKFVRTFTSKKHDFYLIPNQTVHSSGRNNLVLEISATPYIFTFKMYDWLQKDKNGRPRPINITHGLNNLDFTRKGDQVEEKLISKPYVLREENGFKLIHYPTHNEHYYDVHRIDVTGSASIATDNQAHVLMLVEGTAIEVEDAGGEKLVFNFAETFIVPAGANTYTIRNLGGSEAKIVKAFLK
ncbi:class I mannose-6-phosphate isomerase [Parapedobacter pyrenivorans]|uniref:class I mannose-6-phosphate isomerase n=1 Tax=Parapedobacter pyrenivorans TaxID=1305674 RepID=UPI0033414B89